MGLRDKTEQAVGDTAHELAAQAYQQGRPVYCPTLAKPSAFAYGFAVDPWPDDEPSLTMTGKPGHWVRPAFTVTGGGSATGGAEPFGRRARAEMPEGASRISVEEASILQSYPVGFRWDAQVPDEKTGRLKPITKTKTFLQIGNAVPPLMAEAIIVAAVGRADA